MDPAAQLVRIERILCEILHVLGKAPPSARTRELKARAGTFQRALMNFAGRAPRIEQTSALLVSVVDLQTRVLETMPRNAGAGAGSSLVSVPSMGEVIIATPRLSLPMGRPSQRPTGRPPPSSPLSPSLRPTQPPPSSRPTQPPPSSRS